MTQQQLRDKIFDAAWKIVETEGMEQLTVRGIAELSSCSLGALYNVFASFQDLQLQVNANILSRLYQVFHQTTEESLKQNKSYGELLKALGKAYIDFGLKHRFLWKALFEHVPSAPFPEWYVKHAHEGLYHLSKKLSLYYQIPEETLRRSLGFFWASIHGICSVLLNRKLEIIAEFFNADTHLEPYIDYCTKGLFTEQDVFLKNAEALEGHQKSPHQHPYQ